MNQRLAWPAVAVTVAAVAAVCVMAIANVDRETILLCILGLVGPVLTAMLAAQVSGVHQTAQVVERQTNGTAAELLAIVRRQAELLAASTPPARPPATDTAPAPDSP